MPLSTFESKRMQILSDSVMQEPLGMAKTSVYYLATIEQSGGCLITTISFVDTGSFGWKHEGYVTMGLVTLAR